jgi:hypothetical protein
VGQRQDDERDIVLGEQRHGVGHAAAAASAAGALRWTGLHRRAGAKHASHAIVVDGARCIAASLQGMVHLMIIALKLARPATW